MISKSWRENQQKKNVHSDLEQDKGDLVVEELNRMFDHIFKEEQGAVSQSSHPRYSGSGHMTQERRGSRDRRQARLS